MSDRENIGFVDEEYARFAKTKTFGSLDGLRAIATPGADSWRTSWARLLSDRQVTIIMDCDEQGRMAAATIADDLSRVSDVDVLDLAPDRNDGYDLTDRLLEGWEPEVLWR